MVDGPPTEVLTAPGRKRGVTPGLILLGLFGLPFMVLSLFVAVSSLRGAFDYLAYVARAATTVDTDDRGLRKGRFAPYGLLSPGIIWLLLITAGTAFVFSFLGARAVSVLNPNALRPMIIVLLVLVFVISKK